MNIHEYQAKQLLAKYGVTVPFEIPAKSLAEVRPAAEKIAGPFILGVVLIGQQQFAEDAIPAAIVADGRE